METIDSKIQATFIPIKVTLSPKGLEKKDIYDCINFNLNRTKINKDYLNTQAFKKLIEELESNFEANHSIDTINNQKKWKEHELDIALNLFLNSTKYELKLFDKKNKKTPILFNLSLSLLGFLCGSMAIYFLYNQNENNFNNKTPNGLNSDSIVQLVCDSLSKSNQLLKNEIQANNSNTNQTNERLLKEIKKLEHLADSLKKKTRISQPLPDIHISHLASLKITKGSNSIKIIYAKVCPSGNCRFRIVILNKATFQVVSDRQLKNNEVSISLSSLNRSTQYKIKLYKGNNNQPINCKEFNLDYSTGKVVGCTNPNYDCE